MPTGSNPPRRLVPGQRLARDVLPVATSPSSATTEASTAAAAATTTSSAAALVVRFVHAQAAAAEVFSLERSDRCGGARIVHFNETEATRPTRLTIVDQRHRSHRAV